MISNSMREQLKSIDTTKISTDKIGLVCSLTKTLMGYSASHDNVASKSNYERLINDLISEDKLETLSVGEQNKLARDLYVNSRDYTNCLEDEVAFLTLLCFRIASGEFEDSNSKFSDLTDGN